MTNQSFNIEAILSNAVNQLGDDMPNLAKKVANGKYFTTVVMGEDNKQYVLIDFEKPMTYDIDEFRYNTSVLMNSFYTNNTWSKC